MNIKELAINEIKNLDNSDILVIYDLIKTLNVKQKHKKERNKTAYLDAQKALENCKGSMSEDISLLREDRI